MKNMHHHAIQRNNPWNHETRRPNSRKPHHLTITRSFRSGKTGISFANQATLSTNAANPPRPQTPWPEQNIRIWDVFGIGKNAILPFKVIKHVWTIILCNNTYNQSTDHPHGHDMTTSSSLTTSYKVNLLYGWWFSVSVLCYIKWQKWREHVQEFPCMDFESQQFSGGRYLDLSRKFLCKVLQNTSFMVGLASPLLVHVLGLISISASVASKKPPRVFRAPWTAEAAPFETARLQMNGPLLVPLLATIINQTT